jgi:hypothetical protein
MTIRSPTSGTGSPSTSRFPEPSGQTDEREEVKAVTVAAGNR